MNAVSLPRDEARAIKCVVWDLDNTIWDGVLLESDRVELRSRVVDVIKELDNRGILHSIASRNDPERAMAKLRELGLSDYFLYPQINWSSKAANVKQIAKDINLGLSALAFVDDQPFEREEVVFSNPEVLCLDAADVDRFLSLPEMNPRFITDDSKQRREMYLRDIDRKVAQERFVGAEDEFLATLGMVFTISPVGEDDLMRAEELTVRTNQLNSTGYTYSYEELDRLRQSPKHRMLIASLTDKYGSYGKIGLGLLECQADAWRLQLLLMSCRVMSRGVGTVMLNHIMRLAKNAGVRLVADFLPTDRNRMMYITYKFAGFKEVASRDGVTVLESDLNRIQPLPSYVELRT